LLALLDRLALGRPVIISPSMSGRFALPLVTGEPDRVAGFVAIAPVAIRRYKHRLGGITAPVLAVWGEHDRIIPPEQADLLVGSVKRGRIEAAVHGPGCRKLLAFPGERVDRPCQPCRGRDHDLRRPCLGTDDGVARRRLFGCCTERQRQEQEEDTLHRSSPHQNGNLR
jgi:hypothetical protein